MVLQRFGQQILYPVSVHQDRAFSHDLHMQMLVAAALFGSRGPYTSMSLCVYTHDPLQSAIACSNTTDTEQTHSTGDEDPQQYLTLLPGGSPLLSLIDDQVV